MQNQYVYNYRINNITETSRPTINSLQIYKDINGNRTQLTKDSYEIWTQKEEDYYINHVKSIWINIDASDKGSGVKELYIKETLEYDNSLNQIGSFETKTVQYEPNMNYEYNFLTKSDGIVKLEFFVRDMLGNESLNDNNVWTYYVVKDTIFEQQELKHYSISHEQYDLGTEPTALNDVKKNKRAIYFYNLKDKTWFNGRIDSKNNYSFKLYWGEDKNNLIYSTTDVIYDDRLKVPDYPGDTRDLGAYYFVIPEDKIDLTKDTYYALVIIDGVGNEYFCTDLIYGAPVINKVSVKSNSKVEISMFNLDSLKDSEGYYIYYEKIEKNTGISSGLIHNTNPTESLNTFEVLSLDVSAYEYKFYVSKYSYTGGMGRPKFYNIGSLSEPKGTVEYIDGTDNSLILTPSDLDVHVESAGKNTGNYKLTYTVNQDKAARFDSIEAYYKYSLRGSETKVSLGNFTGEQNTFNGIVSHTIILPSTRSYSGQYYYLKKGTNLTKYGIVAVKGSERYTIEIPAEDVSSFAVDNVPPKFKFNQICSATINSITYKSVPTDAYVLNSTDKKQLAAIDADIIHSDLQVNAAGNYYGRCYFIKSKTKWNSYDNVDPINDLSPEEIKQSNLYCDFEYTPLDDSVEIPLPEIEANTRYVLCFQMSDAEGNEFCGPVSFYTKKVTNKKAELSFVDGKSRFIYNILYPPMTNRYGRVSKYASYLNIQYFDISDNTWKYFRQKYIKNGDTYITPYFCNEFGGIPTRNSINDYNGYDYNEQIYFSPIIDYSNPPATAEGPKTSEKLFIRFSMSEAATCGYSPMDYSTAAMDGFTYFEPVYYYNQENCVSGLLNKVNDGYVVLADQPCIIYTVYSKTNYGESVTNWNLNVSDRSHLKTRQLNNLQRYTPDIDNVPIGSYYCVIAHFADGSSQMSQVYRK